MGLTVEKCLQAWTNSLRQMNAKADIVFFGDSLTYYGDFSSVFPDSVVCNLGLRGDTIQGMIDRVEQVKILEPKVVYLMAGINDVATSSPKEFSKKYDILICKLVQSLPDSRLFVQNLLPVNNIDYNISCSNEQIIERNKIIESLAKVYNTQIIDIHSAYVLNNRLPKDLTNDGIHLLPKAYRSWIDILTA